MGGNPSYTWETPVICGQAPRISIGLSVEKVMESGKNGRGLARGESLAKDSRRPISRTSSKMWGGGKENTNQSRSNEKGRSPTKRGKVG